MTQQNRYLMSSSLACQRWILALACVALWLLIHATPAQSAPLPSAAVPQPLQTWVPWAMHGHETLACPAAFNDPAQRSCVWPGHWQVVVQGRGAAFRAQVQVYGAAAWVTLPGQAGVWPQDVMVNERATPVTAQGDRPAVMLPPGTHRIAGQLHWHHRPADLRLPAAVGSVSVSLNGQVLDAMPDEQGRVVLQRTAVEAQASDALSVRTARLIDDDIPMTVTTQVELAVAGKARDIELPAMLLPGFVAMRLDSPIPARLQDDGRLRVQVRPGTWTLRLQARRMDSVSSLTLPEGGGEELWSFVPHNDLRVVSLEGLGAIDPQQQPVPPDWRQHPAYQIRPGQTLNIVESRRGHPAPAADSLALDRSIRLDFDGAGYTVSDRLQGELSRTWRLEVAPPVHLGRVSVDDQALPVTRSADSDALGVELRRGTLRMDADSRIDGALRTLPATGWTVDLASVTTTLQLPPGWRLLHAGGVDQVHHSWISQWTLYDFFFVLLSVVAIFKLLGRWPALALGTALVTTWHMPGAPQTAWVALIALLALVRVLPAGRLHNAAWWGGRACAVVLVLSGLPYAVDQLRWTLHPSLEHASTVSPAGVADSGAEGPDRTQEAAAQAVSGVAQSSRSAALYASAPKSAPRASTPMDIDPSVKVQTGPGVPTWSWSAHRLTWDGPVQAGQTLSLILLPPWANAVFRMTGLVTMLLALVMLVRALPPRRRAEPPGPSPTITPTPAGAPGMLTWAAALAVPMLLLGWPLTSDAKVPAPPVTSPAVVASPDAESVLPGRVVTPDAAVLDTLREKLTEPAACQPQCADLARLQVSARGSKVQLRLDIHSLADVAVPLPGQGTHWRPTHITVDGRPAVTRRDDRGQLWMSLAAGISTVTLSADVGTASTVELTLPMPARAVSTDTDGWTVSGMDDQGQILNVLSLAREAPVEAGGNAAMNPTSSEALEPLVRIERRLRLGPRWTVETRITRAAPSRAPVRVRVQLLPGESVNDERVAVEDGHAVIQLGSDESWVFSSSVGVANTLTWSSTKAPHQIEVWQLEPSAQWHAQWSGLAPIRYVDAASGRLSPTWQPWPGEQVILNLSRPEGVPGPTLTVDALSLHLRPGLRVTDVRGELLLRSSQGGKQVLTLPPGVSFQGLRIDGQPQPLQPQGRELVVPLVPGMHRVTLEWQEPRGIDWRYESVPLSVGAAGVNAKTILDMPGERVVLALGGPTMGPAVLFWGLLWVLFIAAWGLARSRVTPLGWLAWFLLAVGLAPVSMAGAACVAGWLFAMAARGRWADRVVNRVSGHAAAPPWTRRQARWHNLAQVGLVLWAVVAAGVLLQAIQTGLLGYPDLMVQGNGSDAGVLNWYQDRFQDAPQAVWVLSVPVLAYRLLMLAWALWLAVSLVRWAKWAWGCFSAAGYWQRGVAASAHAGTCETAKSGS